MKFIAEVRAEPEMDATGLIIPEEVVAALGGGKRAKVVVQLQGHAYRSSIFPMGGCFKVPLAQAHRAAAGVEAGQRVEVELTLDTALREVEVPEDLAQALAEAGLEARFAALAYSHRKEHVRAVLEAKAPETRARRIAKVLTALSQG